MSRNAGLIRRATTPLESERGSTAPFVLVLTLLLVGVGGLAVDLGGGLLYREVQQNDLAAASDAVGSPDCGMLVKNSDDPGAVIAQTVCSALRANGYSGGIEIWVAEEPASSLPAGKRAIAWGAQTSMTYKPVFAATFGVEPYPVSARVTGSLIPYSSGAAWRPSASGLGGKYAYAANAAPANYSYEPVADRGGFPAEVTTALDAAVEEAKDN